MNSQLIELREQEQYNEGGTDDPIPGSFSVELDKNIVINNNDVIQIRSAFLDSRAESSGKITIDATTSQISMSHYLYMTNFRGNNNFRSVDFDDTLPAVEKGVPDGKYYILNRRLGNPTEDYKKVDSITFFRDPERGQIDSFGGFNATYTYVSPHSIPNKTTITISFPSISLKDNPSISSGKAIINGDLLFVQLNGDLLDFNTTIADSILAKHNCKGQPVVRTEVANIGVHLQPVLFNTKFSIDTGDYTPEELARVITDKMVNLVEYPENTPASTVLNGKLEPVQCLTGLPGVANPFRTFPVKNKFLSSTIQLRNDEFFLGVGASDLQFVANDGKSIMTFTSDAVTDPNYLVGASEMALIFSETSQKFEFQNLHTSHIDGNSQPCIRYFTTSTNRSFVSSSVGGVILQSLEPKELWYDILGFDSSVLCQYDAPVEIASLGNGASTNIFISSFEGLARGINLTSDLSGIDASTIKENFVDSANKDDQKGVDIVSDATTLSVKQTGGTATLGITTITANTSLEKKSYKDGYYLIKIEGLPRQDLVNMPSQNIQAIVSKYFSAGSFLIMEGGSGSMSYKHTGEPFYLNDLKVMITEPDGTRPENLGTNNTVFLEIIKANSTIEY